MPVINLTQHPASPEQKEVGVIDLRPEAREELSQLLTFNDLPSNGTLEARARDVARLVAYEAAIGCFDGAEKLPVMIGGAPFFMAPLERALKAQGHEPLYAFSRRESAEVTQEDGSVRKVAVFRHLGFVQA